MTKLLTEEELRAEIFEILTSTDKSKDDIERLFDLIQSQKVAHGKMVIGEDDPGGRFELNSNFQWGYRNQLRAEQRERNK